MRARSRVLVLVVAGALVAAGCGRGGAEDDVATVKQLDLLGAAEDAGSARVSMHYDATLDEVGLSASHVVADYEGVADFADPRSMWSGSTEMTSIPPEGAVDEVVAPPPYLVEHRSIGDESWDRYWSEGDDPGPWEETSTEVGEKISGVSGDTAAEPTPTTVAGSAGAGGQPDDEGLVDDPATGDGEDPGSQEDEGDDSVLDALDPASLDPSAFLEMLRDRASTYTEEGTEEVRGDQTSRYRADLDIDPEGDDAHDLWPGGEDAGVVRVWLDGDERVRRIEAGALSVELWDFGVPVEVERPDDVSSDGDVGYVGSFFAEVVGDWGVEASGSTAGAEWEVFAAPGRQHGVDVPCRTLELVGQPLPEGNEDLYGDVDIPFPVHGTIPAVCGSSTLALGLGGGAVSDPALQVLSPLGGGFGGEVGSTLVGLIVSPRFRNDPVRLVRDGADSVELALDAAGVAVWDGSEPVAVTAIELGGGAVRCPVADPYSIADDSSDDDQETSGDDAVAGGLSLQLGVGPCVRT